MTTAPNRTAAVGVPVHSLLRAKGNRVVSAPPATLVRDVVALLGEHNIGVVMISETGEDAHGITSERDVVRALSRDGPQALDRPVTEIMTTPVITCRPADSTAHVLALMTSKGIRHLPVAQDGRIIGLLSMRDVSAAYVGALEVATEAMSQYLTGSGY